MKKQMKILSESLNWCEEQTHNHKCFLKLKIQVRGKVLYLYKSESSTNVHIIYHDNLDWPFPDKYSENIGLSIRGFEFVFPNLENSLKKFTESSPTLINSESGEEQTTTVPTQDIFSPEYKAIEDNTQLIV